MKKLLIGSLLVASASATAYYADYGSNSYVKDTVVCGYGRHRGSANDCKLNTYRYFAPRVEEICKRGGRDEDGAILRCWQRLTTGNYGSRAFESREEAREVNREEGQNQRQERRGRRGNGTNGNGGNGGGLD